MKIKSARGIVIKNGSVLLMYREREGKQHYSIPGGKAELGEKLEETVIREVLEETCINVKIEKYLGCFEHLYEDKEQHLFLCKYISGEPKLGNSVEMEKMTKDPSNFYRPEWVALKDSLNQRIQPSCTAEFFKEFVKTYPRE